jgi:acetoin utilization protein AcuB
MRAVDIMTEGVQTVPAAMPAAEAWELMRRKRIHHLIVTSGPQMLGVFSERDAAGRSGASIRARSTVADLMTPNVVSIDPSTPVRKVANLMRGRTIGCIPVRDGERLVGIVTVSDLLTLLGHGAGRAVQFGRRALHHRAPHKALHRARGVW